MFNLNFWSASQFITLVLYGLIVDWRLLGIWLSVFVVYHGLGYIQGQHHLQTNRAKIRMAAWNPPSDPNVYAKIEINLEAADEFIKEKAKEGVRITYTHIGLKSLGMAFASGNEKLTKIVFGRVIPVEDLDILTLIDIDKGKDLAGMTVRKCDKLSIREIMEQISGKISKIKSKKDDDHKKQTGLADFLPTSMVFMLSQIVAFLNYNLSIPIPFMNLKKHQFGSILLTNVSSMDCFEEAFGPINNFLRSIATVVLCTPKDRPIADNGKVRVAKTMNIMITFDHRHLDGAGGTKLMAPIKEVWNNPAKYF